MDNKQIFTVSVTERQTFKRCRRMWDFGSLNRQALTRRVTQKALSIGTLVHLSLADWLENPKDDLSLIFLKHSAQEYTKITEEYKKTVRSEISEIELVPFHESVELGRAMMQNYAAFWKRPLPAGFELVAPEQKVNIKVTDGFVLECKFDGLIKNIRGDIYILEHKTYGSRPNPEYLNSNDQFLAYIWGASQLDIGNVAGIAYDGLWKRAKPPRGSTEQDLFIRTLLHRPEYEIRNFENQLKIEIADMYEVGYRALSNPTVLYPNRRWEGCFDCAFEPLCKAVSAGDDTQFILDNFYTKRTLDEEIE